MLSQISTQLSQLAEQAATQEARKSFVEASKSIQTTSDVSSLLLSQDIGIHIVEKFDHDYVLGIAKRVTDARKEIYDGIGKGIAKVLKAHT